MLAAAIVCALSVVGLAALGFALVIRAERRREASGPKREPHRAVHSTADATLYLRFEGRGARAMEELVAQHEPYGRLPVEALRRTSEALLDALDDATHGALVIAGSRILPVRIPERTGVTVCLRVRSRAPLAVPTRPTHRGELATLLRDLAALDAAQVVSADFLQAKATGDRSAPALEVLLGPHLASQNS